MAVYFYQPGSQIRPPLKQPLVMIDLNATRFLPQKDREIGFRRNTYHRVDLGEDKENLVPNPNGLKQNARG